LSLFGTHPDSLNLLLFYARPSKGGDVSDCRCLVPIPIH